MNDEDLPIRAELASAYLDGELDAVDRATAAADPDVMALVDTYAQVRAVLGVVQPIVDSTRTAAMAAALAEFDALHSAAEVEPAATGATAKVTPLQSRRMRAYRVLTGVAAAAVIGVVAVAAINSSSDRDDATTAVEASAPSEELPGLKVADTSSAADTRPGSDSAAGSQSADQAIESAVALPQIDTSQGLSQYAIDFENRTLAAPAVQPDTTAAPADGAPTDASAEEPPFAQSSLPPCITSAQTVIGGEIMFRGTLAFAVREASNGALRAIDATDCHVLIEVETP
jgi:hypothetical protein